MNLNTTLLGEMITFAIFVWINYAYIWPKITQILEQRKEQIASGLAAAEQGRHLLATAQAQIAEALAASKQQQQALIAHAEKQAANILATTRVEAQAAAAEIIQQGKLYTESRIEEAKIYFREHLSALIIQGAEKILQHNVANPNKDELSKLIAENLPT
jgi:F-type H+-transporting ATPase subunit b